MGLINYFSDGNETRLDNTTPSQIDCFCDMENYLPINIKCYLCPVNCMTTISTTTTTTDICGELPKRPLLII